MKNLRVQTGACRLSFSHIFQADTGLNDEPRYSASIIIRKTDKNTVARIVDAIKTLKADPEVQNVWGGKVPANLKLPLRDGDTDRPEDAAYHGAYFVNASSKRKPNVFDYDRTEILDPESVYSGCYCQFILSLYPYAKKGNMGIGVGLQAVRKIKDGEPLSGGIVSADAWDDSFIDDSDKPNDGLGDLLD